MVHEHFAYLTELHAQGLVSLAGRTAGAEFGIALIETDDEARAREIMDADPVVRAGVFRGQLFPFQRALG